MRWCKHGYDKDVCSQCTATERLTVSDWSERGENILQEAERLVGGERNTAYGHPADDLARIAQLWTAFLGERLSTPLTARDVAMQMVLLKVAREAHAPKRDNLVDIAGYARCAEMLGRKA